MHFRISFLSLLPGLLWAVDPYCPSYSHQQRQADDVRLGRDQAYWRLARARDPQRLALEKRNFIDEFILGKMEADGIGSAPLSSDEEFLRRVYLDLSGRIPTVAQAKAFLSTDAANKRQVLIDELLGSDGYLDRWGLYYRDLFEVTTRYYNYVAPEGRNRFYQFIREFLAADRSYAEVAREIITAEGDSLASGPVNFIVRSIQQGDPTQDTWDTATDRITVRFLGMKTECISCHDARRHLEEINLFLTSKKRTDFWGQSAYFAWTEIQTLPVDAFFRQTRNLVTDRNTGAYYSFVSPQAPGPRPLRYGGPYEPKFILTGEPAAPGKWRAELARQLTGHVQFSRASVNYLWAAMFAQGIVDPPDAWDLNAAQSV